MTYSALMAPHGKSNHSPRSENSLSSMLWSRLRVTSLIQAEAMVSLFAYVIDLKTNVGLSSGGVES